MNRSLLFSSDGPTHCRLTPAELGLPLISLETDSRTSLAFRFAFINARLDNLCASFLTPSAKAATKLMNTANSQSPVRVKMYRTI